MSPVRIRTLAPLAMLALLTAATARPILLRAEAITRTVYVTITDDKGAPVPDLTASNFKVKEGGKDREIVKAEKATTKAHLAIMVEEWHNRFAAGDRTIEDYVWIDSDQLSVRVGIAIAGARASRLDVAEYGTRITADGVVSH